MGLRICVVAACPFPARRGTPLRIERLTQALLERGHDVEVVTYDVAGARAELPFRVTRIGNRETVRHMEPGPNLEKLLLLDPRLAYTLRQRLESAPFDVIHAHHFEGVMIARLAARGRRVPIVYDAHTMLAPELPTYFSASVRPLLHRMGRALDGRLPGLADHIFAVTPDIRDRLIQEHGFAPSAISVVTNGVEIEHFRAGPAGDGVAGRVIYTGTLAAYQGVEELLQAFALVLRTHPGLRLCLSVSSPIGRWLERARSLGIASAIDVLDDDFDQLPDRLAAASIALLPRQHCDGIPQKLLNYMAAGKAIVAFAGSAKVLRQEKTGLIVPNGDVAGFAAAIGRLVDAPELATRLGRAARAYTVAHHSWTGAAALAEDAYDRLIRGRQGRAAEDRATVMLDQPEAEAEVDAPSVSRRVT